jgi:glutamine amidotransferase
MRMLTIVDYGSGNVGSIANMLRRSGVDVGVATTAEAVESASRLILPGIGAFDSVMQRFADSGLMEAVLGRLRAGVPTLGICVGMQILSSGSDEGVLAGLGLVAARTRSLKSMIADDTIRIPHMGWSTLRVRHPSPLLIGLPEGARFYFVHSFAVVCDDPVQEVATVDYGGSDKIAAIVQRDNLFGVQFHPEKSRNFGMALLNNFASIT